MSKVNLSEEVKALNCTSCYLNMPAVITEAQDFRGILTGKSIKLFLFHGEHYSSLTLQLMCCAWWCDREGMAEHQQIIYYFELHKNRGVGRSKSLVCIWHKPQCLQADRTHLGSWDKREFPVGEGPTQTTFGQFHMYLQRSCKCSVLLAKLVLASLS